MTKLLKAIILILFCASLAHAGGVGTTAMQSLKIVADPRVSAMGEAFCGIEGGVNSIASNPGGLAFLKRGELSVAQNNWTEGITNQYLAFGIPVGHIGIIGLNANLLTVKDIVRADADGLVGNNFDASEMAGGLSYALKIGDKFGIGLNAKMLSGKIDNQTASGLAGDAGVLYKLTSNINIGAAVQNVGNAIKYISDKDADPLPMNTKAGVSYAPLNNLVIDVDANSPIDNDMKYNAGVEYTLALGKKLIIPIRAGYRTGLDTGDLSGLAAGAGFLLDNRIEVDAAWTPMGKAFGDSFKIGLTIRL